MNDKVDAVQESIKLALDAADAATDVTSEYNTVRKQHKILEDKVKQIHKYTTVVFVSSIVSGIFVVIVSAFLFMQGSSKLDTMTETSREALVVFAENVDSVNKSLESLNKAIKKQDELDIVFCFRCFFSKCTIKYSKKFKLRNVFNGINLCEVCICTTNYIYYFLLLLRKL